MELELIDISKTRMRKIHKVREEPIAGKGAGEKSQRSRKESS